jgi:hypothetical protein
MTSDFDTAFVLFMFMLSFIFVTVCGLASEMSIGNMTCVLLFNLYNQESW